MSTADLAVIAVTVLGLAHVAADYRLHVKVIAMLGDRLRVAPPTQKAAQDKDGSAEKKVPAIPDIAARRQA